MRVYSYEDGGSFPRLGFLNLDRLNARTKFAFVPVLSFVKMEKLMPIEPAFYTDKDVARTLSLSLSWVRVQRHKRRTGQPHIFDVDARYIGTCPRYLKSDIEAFVATIAG